MSGDAEHMRKFEIRDVSAWPYERDEQLGTKHKHWLREPAAIGGRRWLFKFRQNEQTGDDWAERITAACAEALGLPHAIVELATWQQARGVIVLDFTNPARGDELRLGNNLLQEIDPAYAAASRSRAAEYSLERVFMTLERPPIVVSEQWALPARVATAADVFVGYLLLDALIANQDRNHQNWGVTQRPSGTTGQQVDLVPSFDHASSLGRSLCDEERTNRLSTRDRGYSIESFAHRAKSKFLLSSGGKQRVTTFAAFDWVRQRLPTAADAWLERLRRVDDSELAAIVHTVPDPIMSEPAKRFAIRLMQLNRITLLSSHHP